MLRINLILLCSAATFVSAGSDAIASETNKASGSGLAIEPVPTLPVITTIPTSTTSANVTVSTSKTTTTTIITTSSSRTTNTTPGTSTTKTPPTPVPNPSTGIWSLNGTNVTCIVVQMSAQFKITHHLNKTNEVTHKINLPVANVIVSGNCEQNNQTIILSWNSNMETFNNSFSLHFQKFESNNTYSLHHIELDIDPKEMPEYDATFNETLKFVHTADEYTTPLSHSYRCIKATSFDLVSQEFNETDAVVKLKDLQFQAFRTEKSTSFGQPEDCALDVPDVVPIAVGCALAALVVIVLVAYLIGRRRAQARGYLSM